MEIINYPDAKTVVFCGDIHGDFKLLVDKLCVRYGCRDTLLIVAGDCGFGFEKTGHYQAVYTKLAHKLRKANNWIAFVRGNHDDPSYFEEKKIDTKHWRPCRTIP